MALYTPEERDEVAARLRQLLAGDEHVAHVRLGGSGAHGYADRWSDVDLLPRSLDPARLGRPRSRSWRS